MKFSKLIKNARKNEEEIRRDRVCTKQKAENRGNCQSEDGRLKDRCLGKRSHLENLKIKRTRYNGQRENERVRMAKNVIIFYKKISLTFYPINFKFFVNSPFIIYSL